MASGVLPATGPIPKELERLKVPEVLGLDNNQLSGSPFFALARGFYFCVR